MLIYLWFVRKPQYYFPSWREVPGEDLFLYRLLNPSSEGLITCDFSVIVLKDSAQPQPALLEITEE